MGFLTSATINEMTLPSTVTSETVFIRPQAITDLLVGDYLENLFQPPHGDYRVDWTQFLTQDPEDLKYRRAVLEELRTSPSLVEKISDLVQCLSQIRELDNLGHTDYSADIIRDFSVLHLAYSALEAVNTELNTAIAAGQIQSVGLCRLRDLCTEKLSTVFCVNFDEAWQQQASGLEQLGSLRFRFTVDDELHITGATLTAIQKERFVKSLLPSRTLKENRQPDKPWDMAPPKEMQTPLQELIQVQLSNNSKQFFQTLHRITDALEDLHTDLLFYLSALRYLRSMEDLHVVTSFAEIRPADTKEFSVRNMVNPVLASLKERETISNDITFAPGGEILILTGINQGGKTTFLRAVGTLQLLFQLGWPVPATQAAISPVDQIITVFSHEENTQLQHGKLGQELKTIRAGLDLVTEHSLLLCNEPVTGTSPMENLFLSRKVLAACKLNGYKGVWVTHLYDLASEAEEMNASLSGSRVSSIIAIAHRQGDTVEASYHIERGAPQFTSYAKEVLRQATGLSSPSEA
jgi:hypothetical protein